VKLLIADDSAVMRTLLREICAGVAKEFRDCSDGLEAIAAYAEFQPDWTLMDVTMPRMDGIKATTRIREIYPQARVVMITQHPSLEYERAAREAGACGYFRKDDLRSLPAILGQAA
jgi:two-component system, chemotaxis family, chemotaxis protein CheY